MTSSNLNSGEIASSQKDKRPCSATSINFKLTNYRSHDEEQRWPGSTLRLFPSQRILRGVVHNLALLRREITVVARVNSPLECIRRHLAHRSNRVLHFLAGWRNWLCGGSEPIGARRDSSSVGCAKRGPWRNGGDISCRGVRRGKLPGAGVMEGFTGVSSRDFGPGSGGGASSSPL